MATLLAKWKLVRQIAADHQFTRSDITVALVLLDMINKSDVAWPGLGTIADATGQTVRNVTRSVAKLRDAGFIDITSGKQARHANVYRFKFPKG